MTDEARERLTAAVMGVVRQGLIEAEARGYAKAIAALRDDERYRNWWSAGGAWQHDPHGRYWSPEARGHLADYLEAINQPLTTTDERTPPR